MTTIDILNAGGLTNAEALVAAVGREGVPLWVAAALLQKESGGRNVYGNDVGGTFATPGEPDLDVTETNYAEFLQLVVAQGQKSNGVGPLQITYAGALRPDGTRDGGYFRIAQEQGLRLWAPEDNIAFGLRRLALNLKGDYSTESIERAGTLYNAGNLNGGVTAYGRDLAVKAAAWLTLLTPPPVTPEPGEPMSTPTDLATLGFTSIADFQRMWNLGPALTADGKAGPATRAALALSMKRRAQGLPDISANFSAKEFRCACAGYDDCKRIWATRELVRACEAYRTLVGPMSIVRGCRCPRENKRVNGAKQSQHLYGRAADIEIYDISLTQIKRLGIITGVGLYDWGSKRVPRHIDVRPGNTPSNPATWDYGNAQSAPLTPQPGLIVDRVPVVPPKPEIPKPTKSPEPPVSTVQASDLPTRHPQANPRTTTEEQELMAITVKNPSTGAEWPLEQALWSMWTYSFRAAGDAAAARRVSEAQAAKGGPLTATEITEAVKGAIRDLEAEAATKETV